MDKDEWHGLYVVRLIERGLTVGEAIGTMTAGLKDHDYTYDPEDAADDELSYWTEDG